MAIVITPARIGIAAGAVVFIALIAYFRYVDTFSSLLSKERSGAVTAQEEKIADLEAQNAKAKQEIKAANAARIIAERREKEATGRLAQRNQEIAAWTAKYAELKSRPAQLVTKAGEAKNALRQMGWSQ